MTIYKLSLHPVVPSVPGDSHIKILRDSSDTIHPPVQSEYLNEVLGFFLRTLVKIYLPAELSDLDRKNLKKYLDKVIEAKDTIDGRGLTDRFLTKV